MMWNGAEKRRFPRANITCRIIVYFPYERSITSRTENIGCGGLRVMLKEDLHISSIVGLEIFLDSGKIIKCKGKVVWKLEVKGHSSKDEPLYDFGIEFLSIKDSDKEGLNKLVYSLLQS